MFALVLRQVTRRLRERHHDLDLNAWYLDDGTLVGPRSVLSAVLQELAGPEVRALGLELNLAKCEVWWPSGDASFREFPPEVKRMPHEGVDILKVPVGTDGYIASRLATVVTDMERVLSKLSLLEDPHVEYTLMRSCMGACKLVYRLRAAPAGPRTQEVLERADTALRNALERTLGTGVCSNAWRQAGFRASEGGLGLRHAADAAQPAFLGGVLSAAGLVATLLGREAVSVPGAPEVAAAYQASLDQESQREVETCVGCLTRGAVTAADRESCPTRPQALFQKAWDGTGWRRFLGLQTNRDQQDRLEAVRRPRAGAAWACFPNEALGLKLVPKEFKTAARCWLGLPVYSSGGDGTRELLDQGADQIGRHDAIRDVLFEAARAAGLRPWRERGVDGSRRRPGDVYLPNWSRGRSLAADVTVSHPSQANLSNTAREEGESASLRAAVEAANRKDRKHRRQCETQGVDFLPLAVCSFGGWLPEGVEFVNSLARCLAERTSLEQGVVGAQLWQRLSVTLWRANAQAIMHRAPQADLGTWDLPGYVRRARG